MFQSIRKASLLLSLIACVTFAGGIAALAADNTRYVSITGSNANACTLAAPCRTINKGIAATPPGGELRILNSGFYGNIATIKKSLTISGNGNTIYLNAAVVIDGPGAVVAVRGLVLDGQGTVEEGIRIVQAAAVHVERCVIFGFTVAGLNTLDAEVSLFFLDSIVRENGFVGLFFAPGASGGGRLTVDNSRFENNNGRGLASSLDATITRSISSGNAHIGFHQLGGGRMDVTRSIAANNGLDGFRVQSGSLILESSVARGNAGAGVRSDAGDVVVLSNTVISFNTTGVRNGGGMLTRGNNILRQNTTDVDGNMPGVVPGF